MADATSDATQMTPFYADLGLNPRSGTNPTNPLTTTIDVTTPPDLDEPLREILTEVHANLSLSRANMADSANHHRHASPAYAIGDLVYLSTKNLRTRRPAKKLDDKWMGPFEIDRVINARAYHLDLPPSLRVHPVFHANMPPPARS